MTYAAAKKLHNGDEVIDKKTEASLRVISTTVDADRKAVFILCDDGISHYHTEVR